MGTTGIAILDRSFQRQDRSGFEQSLRSLDWSALSADALLGAIQYALTLEMVKTARELNATALQHFPGDPRFRALAAVLAPAVVEGTRLASPGDEEGDRASQKWLEQHQPEYVGQWVALKDGVLLGADSDLLLLRDRLGGPSALQKVLLLRVLC